MTGPTAALDLPCREPYDWAGVRAFLAARAIPGVEAPDGAYARTVRGAAGRCGVLSVAPAAGGLAATLDGLDPADLPDLAGRLGRLFDAAADPGAIAARLGRDPDLAPLVAARPGLRLPGAWDPFETGVRAILGQQVSVAAARVLAGRLALAFGAPLARPAGGLARLFPRPEDLAGADVAAALNMPRVRGAAVRALAAAALDDPGLFAPAVDPNAAESDAADLDATVARFTAIPGIGPWTAQYIALRALKLPDALPAADVGLLRALDRGAGRPTPAQLLARAEGWRPFRAYAAQHLWAADAARRPAG